MELSKAIGAINRTLLWATLYKKGLHGEMAKHIRRGHVGTRLAPKYKGKYGKLKENNIGVFHGSAIRAIPSIIYLDDVMEDLEALSRRTELPMRIVQERPHQQQEALMWEEIQEDGRNEYREKQEMYTIKNYTSDDNPKVEIRKTNSKNREMGQEAGNHMRQEEERRRIKRDEAAI